MVLGRGSRLVSRPEMEKTTVPEARSTLARRPTASHACDCVLPRVLAHHAWYAELGGRPPTIPPSVAKSTTTSRSWIPRRYSVSGAYFAGIIRDDCDPVPSLVPFVQTGEAIPQEPARDRVGSSSCNL